MFCSAPVECLKQNRCELSLVLSRYVEDPEAVAAALGRVWGVFEAALARFHDDERTAEHLCRAPRYALRTAVRAGPWCSARVLPECRDMSQAEHECLAEIVTAA